MLDLHVAHTLCSSWIQSRPQLGTVVKMNLTVAEQRTQRKCT